MSKGKSWTQSVKEAKHYKALGQLDVYLSEHDGNGDDRPWKFVTEVTPGGTHRLDMDTSVWFSAKHPCGLRFRWSVDVEDRDANGQGHYKINTGKLRGILNVLPADARKQFQEYLADAARKVHQKAGEWAAIVDRQRSDAATLALLATEPR